jgi:hypothetical protein
VVATRLGVVVGEAADGRWWWRREWDMVVATPLGDEGGGGGRACTHPHLSAHTPTSKLCVHATVVQACSHGHRSSRTARLYAPRFICSCSLLLALSHSQSSSLAWPHPYSLSWSPRTHTHPCLDPTHTPCSLVRAYPHLFVCPHLSPLICVRFCLSSLILTCSCSLVCAGPRYLVFLASHLCLCHLHS